MAVLDLGGAHEVTREEIERVCRTVGAGNFALGAPDDYSWIPRYIGRSDSDVKQEILSRLDPKYKEFKLAYALTSEGAFKKHAKSYHDFGGPEGRLDNDSHPAPPVGYLGGCPVAGCTQILPAATPAPAVRPIDSPFIKIPGAPEEKRETARVSIGRAAARRPRAADDEAGEAFLSIELDPGEELVPYRAYDYGQHLRFQGKTWRVTKVRMVTPPMRYTIELLESRPDRGNVVIEWDGPADKSRVSSTRAKRVFRQDQR